MEKSAFRSEKIKLGRESNFEISYLKISHKKSNFGLKLTFLCQF
jgi:hypothetical protein